MIPDVLASRYASNQMSDIWSQTNKIILERKLWVAVMKAQQELGLNIPAANITDYEKAIELDPEDAVAFNNLGLVEEKMGRMEKAKDYFEKADSLSGYPPKKEAEVTPSETPNQTEKPKPTRPNTPVFKPKLTMGHFMEVVQGIFTKSEVRKEFTTYIKGVFGKK